VHELRSLGLTLECGPSDIVGRPDIVFRKSRFVAFVHGCFWHRCPRCNPHFPGRNAAYWGTKFERNRIRDNRVRRLLVRGGWRTAVVWECQVRDDAAAQAARIARRLATLADV
jgi:DNA mismatch endonuclease (patch repair protein)